MIKYTTTREVKCDRCERHLVGPVVEGPAFDVNWRFPLAPGWVQRDGEVFCPDHSDGVTVPPPEGGNMEQSNKSKEEYQEPIIVRKQLTHEEKREQYEFEGGKFVISFFPIADHDSHIPTTAIKYLRGKEWSMGNGQCPECYGLSSKLRSYYPSRLAGHHPQCLLAVALEELGDKPLFKSDPEKEKYYESLVKAELELQEFNPKPEYLPHISLFP